MQGCVSDLYPVSVLTALDDRRLSGRKRGIVPL